MSENIPYIIAEDGYYYVAYKEKVKSPYIVVSSKGVANGLSEEYNDGWDFGPDSYSPTSTSAIPYTQTYGIQEAYNYAVSLQNYEYPADIVLEEGVYTINESIIIPLDKYGQAPTLIGKGINTQIVPSSDFSGSALIIGSWHGSTSIFPNSVIIKDLSIYASNSDAVDLSAGFERAGSNKSGIFNCNINAPSGYYAVNADKIENINLAYGDYNGAVSYQVPDGTAIITAVFIESEGLTLVAQQANLIDDVFSAPITIPSAPSNNITNINLTGSYFNGNTGTNIINNSGALIKITGSSPLFSSSIANSSMFGGSSETILIDTSGAFIQGSNSNINLFASTINGYITDKTVTITGVTNNQSQVATPTVPASGSSSQNTNPYPVKVYVQGGALTEIQITIGSTTYTVYSNSTASAVYEGFTLPAGASITLTYSTAPTWSWVPE